jgi:hypothetical protein
VGAWPVQFLPAFNALTREAMVQAEACELDGIPSRVVRAEYLATIALSTGRSKDHERILALLESGRTSQDKIDILRGGTGWPKPGSDLPGDSSMNDAIRNLLAKQSHWQKSRRDLPWEEKIRMVERVRDEVARWLPVYRANATTRAKPEGGTG